MEKDKKNEHISVFEQIIKVDERGIKYWSEQGAKTIKKQ